MRVLLTTLNARFSHSSLALRYIRGVLREIPGLEVDLKEFTINQPADEVLNGIFTGGYDCVCFSTYIWNVEMILKTCANLRKVAPDTRIILGGPEVSHSPATVLQKSPFIDGLIMGEGEDTLRNLFTMGFEKPGWQSLAGTAWNAELGMRINPAAPLIQDLDTIPFPYGEEDCFDNRLVYYESSRGCPYQCSYCLSSATEGVRYFPLERVFKDLDWLLSKNIQTVKFVDRTFNVKQDHALPILDYIETQDNGITCFHFEISAGILTPAFMDRCASMRANLVQFEIGVQSTCPEALKACGRPDWTLQIKENVARLRAPGNIHLHLDLIAGLPYEGYKRFLESFNGVYEMRPHMLQLGFLKLIQGTAMRRKAGFYGFQWREEPPYEVLESKWITYGELSSLKQIESLLDRYYQQGKFEKTLELLEVQFEAPSDLYETMAAWWQNQGCWDRNVGQDEAWLLMYDFAIESGVPLIALQSAMRWDCIFHHKPKGFQGTVLAPREPDKALQHQLLHQRDSSHGKWAPYGDTPAKQLLKHFHFETFNWDPEQPTQPPEAFVICFDTHQSPSAPVFRWKESEILHLQAGKEASDGE